MIREHTEENGWKGTIKLTKEMETEMQFFLEQANERNGTPIRNKSAELRLELILKNPIAKVKNC